MERSKESLGGRETLAGVERLLGRNGIGGVLGTSYMARSRLGALLERPEFLSSDQEGELKALVGPEWGRLGVDIERYRNWSARAVALLRAIDGTPPDALSDAHWMALLGEARRAVEEAHVAASHIDVVGDLARRRSSYTSIQVRERPGTSTRGGMIQAPVGPGTSIPSRKTPGESLRRLRGPSGI
jgi:hypothetical protein